MKKTIIMIALGLGICSALCVQAGDFDGSKPLICAVLNTVACPRNDAVAKGDAESVNLPQFFHIDFAKKLITGKGPDGDVRTTKIDKITHEDGQLILQGVQKGKAWSAVIDEKTGKTVIVGAANDIGIVVFGACTPK